MKTTINLCLNDLSAITFFFDSDLSEHVENKTIQHILHSCWLLNRGKNNRKMFIVQLLTPKISQRNQIENT